MKKFVIASSYDSVEGEYVREACKLTDTTLVNSDFDIIVANGEAQAWSAAIQHYLDSRFKDMVVKPIILHPYSPGILGESRIPDCFRHYPNIPVISAFYGQGALPSLPAGFTLKPNRIPHFITCSGGKLGLSDFYTGAGLEFTEEAPLQYIDAGNNILSFSLTNITNVAGVARLFNSTLPYFGAANILIHIEGVSGFQNNINGKRAIATVNTGGGYITVNFDLGTGTFSGPATVKINWVSGAIGVVAAKIHKIMRTRNCSFWEARYCARQTGSEGGVHDNTKGYGYINVDDAIAYDDAIPVDEFDTLGSIGTLSLEIDSQNRAVFSHPEIINARQMRLFANGEEIKLIDELLPGFSLESGTAYVHSPVKLGNINYYLKGYRDAQSTTPSNSVHTNFAELEDKPAQALYETEDGEPYGITVYYLNGASVKSSTIESIHKYVVNPNNDNVGVQENFYQLANGDLVKERYLYASLRDLAYNVIRPSSLTGLQPLRVDVYSPFADLCGQNFNNTDFTDDGSFDYDFTGAIVRNTSFVGATLPEAYADPDTGIALFLSQVAFCDIKTTIWINGVSIKSELES